MERSGNPEIGGELPKDSGEQKSDEQLRREIAEIYAGLEGKNNSYRRRNEAIKKLSGYDSEILPILKTELLDNNKFEDDEVDFAAAVSGLATVDDIPFIIQTITELRERNTPIANAAELTLLGVLDTFSYALRTTNPGDPRLNEISGGLANLLFEKDTLGGLDDYVLRSIARASLDANDIQDGQEELLEDTADFAISELYAQDKIDAATFSQLAEDIESPDNFKATLDFFNLATGQYQDLTDDDIQKLLERKSRTDNTSDITNNNSDTNRDLASLAADESEEDEEDENPFSRLPEPSDDAEPVIRDLQTALKAYLESEGSFFDEENNRDRAEKLTEFYKTVAEYGNEALPYLKENILTTPLNDPERAAICNAVSAVAEVKDYEEILDLLSSVLVYNNRIAYASLTPALNNISLAIRLQNNEDPRLTVISNRLISQLNDENFRQVSARDRTMQNRLNTLFTLATTGTDEARDYLAQLKEKEPDIDSINFFRLVASNVDRVPFEALRKFNLTTGEYDSLNIEKILEYGKTSSTESLTAEEKRTIDSVFTTINTPVTDTFSQRREKVVRAKQEIGLIGNKALPYFLEKYNELNISDEVILGDISIVVNGLAENDDYQQVLKLLSDPNIQRSKVAFRNILETLNRTIYSIRYENPDDSRLRVISAELLTLEDDDSLQMENDQLFNSIALAGIAKSFIDASTKDELRRRVLLQKASDINSINPDDFYRFDLVGNSVIRLDRFTYPLKDTSEVITETSSADSSEKSEVNKERIDTIVEEYKNNGEKGLFGRADFLKKLAPFGREALPYIKERLNDDPAYFESPSDFAYLASNIAEVADYPLLFNAITSVPNSGARSAEANEILANTIKRFVYGLRKNDPEDPRIEEISQRVISLLDRDELSFPKNMLFETLAVTGTTSASEYITEKKPVGPQENYFERILNNYEGYVINNSLAVFDVNDASFFTKLTKEQLERYVDQARSSASETSSLQNSESETNPEKAEKVKLYEEILPNVVAILRGPYAEKVSYKLNPFDQEREGIVSVESIDGSPTRYALSITRPGPELRNGTVPSQALSIKFLNSETNVIGEVLFSNSDEFPVLSGKNSFEPESIATFSNEWSNGNSVQRRFFGLSKEVTVEDLRTISSDLLQIVSGYENVPSTTTIETPETEAVEEEYPFVEGYEIRLQELLRDAPVNVNVKTAINQFIAQYLSPNGLEYVKRITKENTGGNFQPVYDAALLINETINASLRENEDINTLDVGNIKLALDTAADTLPRGNSSFLNQRLELLRDNVELVLEITKQLKDNTVDTEVNTLDTYPFASNFRERIVDIINRESISNRQVNQAVDDFVYNFLDPEALATVRRLISEGKSKDINEAPKVGLEVDTRINQSINQKRRLTDAERAELSTLFYDTAAKLSREKGVDREFSRSFEIIGNDGVELLESVTRILKEEGVKERGKRRNTEQRFFGDDEPIPFPDDYSERIDELIDAFQVRTGKFDEEDVTDAVRSYLIAALSPTFLDQDREYFSDQKLSGFLSGEQLTALQVDGYTTRAARGGRVALQTAEVTDLRRAFASAARTTETQTGNRESENYKRLKLIEERGIPLLSSVAIELKRETLRQQQGDETGETEIERRIDALLEEYSTGSTTFNEDIKQYILRYATPEATEFAAKLRIPNAAQKTGLELASRLQGGKNLSPADKEVLKELFNDASLEEREEGRDDRAVAYRLISENEGRALDVLENVVSALIKEEEQKGSGESTPQLKDFDQELFNTRIQQLINELPNLPREAQMALYVYAPNLFNPVSISTFNERARGKGGINVTDFKNRLRYTASLLDRYIDNSSEAGNRPFTVNESDKLREQFTYLGTFDRATQPQFKILADNLPTLQTIGKQLKTELSQGRFSTLNAEVQGTENKEQSLENFDLNAFFGRIRVLVDENPEATPELKSILKANGDLLFNPQNLVRLRERRDAGTLSNPEAGFISRVQYAALILDDRLNQSKAFSPEDKLVIGDAFAPRREYASESLAALAKNVDVLESIGRALKKDLEEGKFSTLNEGVSVEAINSETSSEDDTLEQRVDALLEERTKTSPELKATIKDFILRYANPSVFERYKSKETFTPLEAVGLELQRSIQRASDAGLSEISPEDVVSIRNRLRNAAEFLARNESIEAGDDYFLLANNAQTLSSIVNELVARAETTGENLSDTITKLLNERDYGTSLDAETKQAIKDFYLDRLTPTRIAITERSENPSAAELAATRIDRLIRESLEKGTPIPATEYIGIERILATALQEDADAPELVKRYELLRNASGLVALVDLARDIKQSGLDKE